MSDQDAQQPRGLQPHAPFCVACQAPLSGAFCGHCGEKVLTTHDYSLAHFAERALEILTHVDFKFWSTLKILISKPGQLTRDYLDGRRKSRVAPIQLFVLINIAFALLIHISGSTPFTTKLKTQLADPPVNEIKVQVIEAAMAEKGLPREEFERAFNKAAEMQGKAWVIIMIPAFAVLFTVLYGFRRWFFEMLVFSSHYWCFLLLWLLSEATIAKAVAKLVDLLWQVGLSYSEYETLTAMITMIGLGIYQYHAQRRAFGDRWWASLLRVVATVLVFYFPLLYYRFLLLFLTLWAM